MFNQTPNESYSQSNLWSTSYRWCMYYGNYARIIFINIPDYFVFKDQGSILIVYGNQVKLYKPQRFQTCLFYSLQFTISAISNRKQVSQLAQTWVKHLWSHLSNDTLVITKTSSRLPVSSRILNYWVADVIATGTLFFPSQRLLSLRKYLAFIFPYN